MGVPKRLEELDVARELGLESVAMAGIPSPHHHPPRYIHQATPAEPLYGYLEGKGYGPLNVPRRRSRTMPLSTGFRTKCTPTEKRDSRGGHWPETEDIATPDG